MSTHNARELLEKIFRAAIESAQPIHGIPLYLPEAPAGRLVVIGAGKASAEMARVVEQYWPEPISGLVVTRYGHSVPCERIEIVEAAHPVPDAAGLEAARRLMALVSGLSADDTVLCLISGGGSALLPLPLDGISLEDKQAVSRELLKCGASIREINCVRRHLSAIKGGRLAAACYPAKVVTLLISDVPGDNPCDIASGPTVGDPTTCADALAIVRRYGISLPENVRRILESGDGESIKPDDLRVAECETHLIATPQMALEAAADPIAPAAPAIPREPVSGADVRNTTPPPASGDARATAAATPAWTRLSDREREVAELVLQGMPYRDIGARLLISAKTVEHHVARIRRRLGAESRSEMLSMLRALLVEKA